MTLAKYALLLIFASGAVSWTIDMKDIKKLILENKHKVNSIDKQNEVYDASEYAQDYEYQSYREKQLSDVVVSGSNYLEGLSNALAEYRLVLERCGTGLNLTSSASWQQARPEPARMPAELCERATNSSTSVRQLSDLIIQLTNKLRQRVDVEKSEEETEMLTRLAWLLDRLARLTGYVPSQRDAATDSNSPPKITTAASPHASLEILEQMENGRAVPDVVVQKQAPAKTMKKRSLDNPLEEVANYYLKYKVWISDNPEHEHDANEKGGFDVENNFKIKPIQKRSINKKAINLRVADDISNTIKEIKINTKIQNFKIKSTLQKLQDKSLKIKNKLKKGKKAKVFL